MQDASQQLEGHTKLCTLQWTLGRPWGEARSQRKVFRLPAFLDTFRKLLLAPVSRKPTNELFKPASRPMCVCMCGGVCSRYSS